MQPLPLSRDRHICTYAVAWLLWSMRAPCALRVCLLQPGAGTHRTASMSDSSTKPTEPSCRRAMGPYVRTQCSYSAPKSLPMSRCSEPSSSESLAPASHHITAHRSSSQLSSAQRMPLWWHTRSLLRGPSAWASVHACMPRRARRGATGLTHMCAHDDPMQSCLRSLCTDAPTGKPHAPSERGGPVQRVMLCSHVHRSHTDTDLGSC